MSAGSGTQAIERILNGSGYHQANLFTIIEQIQDQHPSVCNDSVLYLFLCSSPCMCGLNYSCGALSLTLHNRGSTNDVATIVTGALAVYSRVFNPSLLIFLQCGRYNKEMTPHLYVNGVWMRFSSYLRLSYCSRTLNCNPHRQKDQTEQVCKRSDQNCVCRLHVISA